jgi:hypothetical protein
MNKATTISLIIFGPIALGVLLMATGTPPGVVGFFIFITIAVFLPTWGGCFLISLLFKSNGSRDTDYSSSMEKDKIQRSDVKPTDRKVSCPRCYAFVPGDQPNCTSCGKPLP